MFKKSLFKILLKDLFILFIIVLSMELFLRFNQPDLLIQFYSPNYTGSFPINLNNQGFRGPEIPKEKKSNEYRIMALGDSVTFGTGVSEEDTWPEQLRALLLSSMKSKRDVTVINTAVPAIDLGQIIYAINETWNEYHPDLYILDFTANLVSLSFIRKNDPAGFPQNEYIDFQKKQSNFYKIRYAFQSIPYFSATYVFISKNVEKLNYLTGISNFNIDPKSPYGPMLAHGWQQVGLDPQIFEKAWTNIESELEKLKQTVEKHEASLIIAISPLRFMLTNNPSDNQKFVPYERITINPILRLKEICKKLNIPFVDVTPQLLLDREIIEKKEGRFEPMYIMNDFTHLNAAGHKATAEALYKVMN